MKRLALVTPVWGRYDLTDILFHERTILQRRALEHGVEVQTVVIGDDKNLALAERLGFATIEAPNHLARKYNDGHEWAVRNGYDVSFQVNSDQVFDPRLLIAIGNAPAGKLVQTRWLTAVHDSGRACVQFRNPMWAMKAYPADLLANNPRPAQELFSNGAPRDRGCDRAVHEGVVAANPQLRVQTEDRYADGQDVHWVEIGPLEVIQFNSGNQLTRWYHWLVLAQADGFAGDVPWTDIEEQHGRDFVEEIQDFYGV